MADLKLVTNAMFYKKSEWVNITDKEKEECFFIINRMFCKKYPEKSQLFNSKVIDKVSAMNLWYHFMLNKPYPDIISVPAPRNQAQAYFLIYPKILFIIVFIC